MSANRSIEKATAWKTQAYVAGAAVGLLLGVMGAYLYGRAAEDTAQEGGEPQRIQTMQLVGIGLALLGILRQVAELGKPAKK